LTGLTSETPPRKNARIIDVLFPASRYYIFVYHIYQLDFGHHGGVFKNEVTYKAMDGKMESLSIKKVYVNVVEKK